MSASRQRIALAAIILVALALRAYRVDWQSAWYDENYTLYTSGLDAGPMQESIVRDFVHPPLHYYLLHYWMKVFGFGQLPARLMSLVFGVLSVPLIFLLGRLLFGPAAGLMAALLLAVSQLGVNHSQEARAYSLALFLVLGSIYAFARAVRERRSGFWWAYVATSILMVYSHYYTAFVVLAQLAFAVIYRRRYPTPMRWWVLGASVAVLAYLPWLASGILENMVNSSKVGGHDPDAMRVRWYTPISSLNWFHNGKWNGLYAQSPLWSYPAGCFLFGIPVLLALGPQVFWRREADGTESERSSTAMLLLLFLVPIATTVGISHLANLQFDVRYIVFAIAPYYVLAGHGLARIRPVAVRAAFVTVLLAYSVAALRANYYIPYKPDYRAAAAYLASHYRDGDCASFSMRLLDGLPLFWRVHQPDHPGLRIHPPDELLTENPGCQRIWLLWDHTWWRNSANLYEGTRDALADKYRLVESHAYYSIDLHLYEPR